VNFMADRLNLLPQPLKAQTGAHEHIARTIGAMIQLTTSTDAGGQRTARVFRGAVGGMEERRRVRAFLREKRSACQGYDRDESQASRSGHRRCCLSTKLPPRRIHSS